jgi:16S rRNA (uracil1498-N3)-methyltransferase
LRLDTEQSRRLSAVMRLREGDEFRVFSGDGREWAAEVTAVTKASLTATLGECVRQEAPPALSIEVWCSLVRPNRFDWAIEKCTEAGADVIRPLLTEHTARGEGASAARAERWQRIAIEAAEQSRRLYVPVVQPLAQFNALLARPPGPLLIADREGRPWRDIVPLLPERGAAAIAIGPEGGFSEAELAAARARGALLVSLGPNILRTETAAVVATAGLRMSR